MAWSGNTFETGRLVDVVGQIALYELHMITI